MAATIRRREVADASESPKQRLNIKVSADAAERLAIHAIKSKVTVGRLVEQLIEKHCREWRVQANPSTHASVGSDRLSGDGPVSKMGMSAV